MTLAVTRLSPTSHNTSPMERTWPHGRGMIPPRKPRNAPSATSLPPLSTKVSSWDSVSTTPADTSAAPATGVPQFTRVTSRFRAKPAATRIIPPVRMFNTAKASTRPMDRRLRSTAGVLWMDATSEMTNSSTPTMPIG